YSVGKICRFSHDLPHFEIHGIGPAETDFVGGVAGAHMHVGVALDHVVFFADGAVPCEAFVHRVVPFVGDALRIRAIAGGIEAGVGDPVSGRPSERLIPLHSTAEVTHG